MGNKSGERYEIPYSPFKMASDRIMMARNCTVQMRTIFDRISKISREVSEGDIAKEIAKLEKESAELTKISMELAFAVQDMKEVNL